MKKMSPMRWRVPSWMWVLFGLTSLVVLACGGDIQRKRVKAPRKTEPSVPVAFELEAYDGKMWRSVDYRGKPLLVTVFTSWCQPCLTILQELDATRDVPTLASSFNVVAVSVDQALEPMVRAFLEEVNVRFPVLMADRRMQHGHSPFGRFVAVPITYLLDAEGRLVEFFEGSVPVAYIARRISTFSEEEK